MTRDAIAHALEKIAAESRNADSRVEARLDKIEGLILELAGEMRGHVAQDEEFHTKATRKITQLENVAATITQHLSGLQAEAGGA